MSTHDLQEWNRRISDSGDFLFHHTGLTQEDWGSLANILLRSASTEQVARLRRFLPGLEPTTWVDGTHPTHVRSGSDIPIFTPGANGPSPETEINQGLDGDCWVLSALGAIGEWHPDLLARHLRANANGTYTVTLYRDGHPSEVTVTDDYPAGQGEGYVYAQAPPEGGKWAMIYEKAYAQFKGGYASINGGYEEVSLSDITGARASSDSTRDHTLADINDKIQKGYVSAAMRSSP